MTTDRARAGLRAVIRLQHEARSTEHARAIDDWRLVLDQCNGRDEPRCRLDRLAARPNAKICLREQARGLKRDERGWEMTR